MRRATPPTEILLGFAAGAIAAFFIAQPLIWFLSHLGITARVAYSTYQTPPLGVDAVWSRVFWGGAFGVATAWFGLRYPLGVTYVVNTSIAIAALRTIADWFIVPMFFGRLWVGWSVDGILTPLLVNFVWAFATTLLCGALTVAAGTWGNTPVEL